MFITPNWPAPESICAVTTTRLGGVSVSPYDQFNLAEHVGDLGEHVLANREILRNKLNLPAEPTWINQIHSAIAISAHPTNTGKEADATYTHERKQVCAILTADCLPLLICSKQGSHVAAIHAGWRGLATGVIAATLRGLQLAGSELLAWLGPAIGGANYEVGHEVREQFIQHDPQLAAAFTPSPNQRWLADLYTIAKLQLAALGVTQVYGGEFCTFSDKKRFYSYRRDGSQTGRMASLIWIK